MEKGWKLVYFTAQEYQAILAREILEENGIEALVINHKDSMLTSFGDLEVYVREDNENRAVDIVKKLKSGEN